MANYGPKDPVVRKNNNQSQIGYGEEAPAIKNKTPTIVKINNLAKWNDTPTAITTRPTIIRGTDTTGPGWQNKQYWPNGYYQITYNSSNLKSSSGNAPVYIAASLVKHSSVSRTNANDYVQNGDFVQAGTTLYIELVVPTSGANVWYNSSLTVRYGRAVGSIIPEGGTTQYFFKCNINGIDPAPLVEQFTVNNHTLVSLAHRGNAVKFYNKSSITKAGQVSIYQDIRWTPNSLRYKYNGADQTTTPDFDSDSGTLVQIAECDLTSISSGWTDTGSYRRPTPLFEGGPCEYRIYPANTTTGRNLSLSKVQSTFASSESDLDTWDSSWPQEIDSYDIEKYGNGIWSINMSSWILGGDYYQDRYTFSSDTYMRRTLGFCMWINNASNSALYLSDTNSPSAAALNLDVLDIQVEKAQDQTQQTTQQTTQALKAKARAATTVPTTNTIQLTEANVGKVFKDGYVAPSEPILLSPGDKVTITVTDPDYYIGTNYAYGFDTLYPEVGEPSTTEGVQTITFTVPSKTTDGNQDPEVGYDILTLGLHIKKIGG